MTTPPQMTILKYWVWFDDTPDDEPVFVRSRNSDLILWDDTLPKHPTWKGPETSPFRFHSFVAWAAMRRQGLIGDETFEAFAERVQDITPITTPGRDPAGSPTPPGPDPG